MEEIITLKQIEKVISEEQKSNYINNFQYLCENRLLNWYKIGAILKEDDSIYFFKLED